MCYSLAFRNIYVSSVFAIAIFTNCNDSRKFSHECSADVNNACMNTSSTSIVTAGNKCIINVWISATASERSLCLAFVCLNMHV